MNYIFFIFKCQSDNDGIGNSRMTVICFTFLIAAAEEENLNVFLMQSIMMEVLGYFF